MINVVENVKKAGVIGAGGAGFPTHVKLSSEAEIVIANGAECEPLLRVDQQVMALCPDELVRGMKYAMSAVGAKSGVIALKRHYEDAIEALTNALAGEQYLSLLIMDSTYPVGDEQQLVYEVTGRVVPTGGIPLDVGAVVVNVSTLVNITKAQEGTPVTDKYVTVGGAVKKPATFNVPIGISFEELINRAGGADEPCAYIVGGPCMGYIVKDLSEVVTKTTSGIIAVPEDHPLVKIKGPGMNIQLIKAVCCQCTMCSQMCPRNMLGLNVEPHKAMRSLAQGVGLVREVNGVFSCSDCGICTYYACNFGLKPSRVMAELKRKLAADGVAPEKKIHSQPDAAIDTKRIPVTRLIGRMGLRKFDKPAPLDMTVVETDRVVIPLKMHIGAPSVPVAEEGQTVIQGDLIAKIPENSLGANVHASISGVVESVTDKAIIIRKDQERKESEGL